MQTIDFSALLIGNTAKLSRISAQLTGGAEVKKWTFYSSCTFFSLDFEKCNSSLPPSECLSFTSSLLCYSVRLVLGLVKQTKKKKPYAKGVEKNSQSHFCHILTNSSKRKEQHYFEPALENIRNHRAGEEWEQRHKIKCNGRVIVHLSTAVQISRTFVFY